MSSASGLPKNPPTSAPTNDSAATLRPSSIGAATARWDHLDSLSPVHIAPYRWLPAKKDRDSTKGRTFPSSFLRTSPSPVDLWKSIPYRLCHSRCSQPARLSRSFCMLTSGPLKTDGSFISFQVNRSGVEPLYLSYPN